MATKPVTPAKRGTKKDEPALPVPIANAALPAFLQSYQGPMGTEDIGAEDVTIPRLKIGQDMSPEVQSGAVKRGDLYLNVTGEVLWSEGQPLKAIIVARTKEFILWRPREDNGGGILARAHAVKFDGVTRYLWDSPNTSFDVKVKGIVKATWKTGEFIDQDGLDQWGSEIPGDAGSGIAATAHHNYILLLPDLGYIVAVSLSRSSVKKAKDLNAAIKMGKPGYPLVSRLWNFSTVDEKNDSGAEYKNFEIKPAGYLGNDDAALFTRADAVAKSFATQKFTVDQSDGGETADTSGKF